MDIEQFESDLGMLIRDHDMPWKLRLDDKTSAADEIMTYAHRFVSDHRQKVGAQPLGPGELYDILAWPLQGLGYTRISQSEYVLYPSLEPQC